MIPQSIRTFIGAKNYALSQQFYRDLGFEQLDIGDQMTYFKVSDQLGFYLQDYYVKDWVDNSMVFLEVADLDECFKEISSLKLTEKYPGVRLLGIKELDWGREFFLHDPSGILWHFGTFKRV